MSSQIDCLKKTEEYLHKALLSISDAEDLKGSTIRLIESYPNHPGLVVLRGLVELLIKDTNENQYLQNLQDYYPCLPLRPSHLHS